MNHLLIGKSPNFEAMLRSASLISATDVTVLILGETGVGKEVLADLIFKNSPRANKRFDKINCAALPENLAESELFGHCKGSFTGADSAKTGRLQAAHGGTVFLDEIDSMPLAIQAKLLRFLDSGECQAVGEATTRKVNVRIIAATNADLNEKVKAGSFRQDLYYRLNVIPIQIPSLKERNEDIEALSSHFMRSFAKEHGLQPASFSPKAMECLTGYSWPGNIRELRNFCERLSILRASKIIEPENLPHEIRNSGNQTKSTFTLPEEGLSLEKLEAELIRQALGKTHGNQSRSARLLGLTRDTLLYRMQKHGIRA